MFSCKIGALQGKEVLRARTTRPEMRSKRLLESLQKRLMMSFIHVSMYLADANWGHNIKNKE